MLVQFLLRMLGLSEVAGGYETYAGYIRTYRNTLPDDMTREEWRRATSDLEEEGFPSAILDMTYTHSEGSSRARRAEMPLLSFRSSQKAKLKEATVPATVDEAAPSEAATKKKAKKPGNDLAAPKLMVNNEALR